MSTGNITTGSPVDGTGSPDGKALLSNSTTTTNVDWAAIAQECGTARDALLRLVVLEPFPVIRDWIESTARYLNGLAIDAHREGLKVDGNSH